MCEGNCAAACEGMSAGSGARGQRAQGVKKNLLRVALCVGCVFFNLLRRAWINKTALPRNSRATVCAAAGGQKCAGVGVAMAAHPCTREGMSAGGARVCRHSRAGAWESKTALTRLGGYLAARGMV